MSIKLTMGLILSSAFPLLPHSPLPHSPLPPPDITCSFACHSICSFAWLLSAATRRSRNGKPKFGFGHSWNCSHAGQGYWVIGDVKPNEESKISGMYFYFLPPGYDADCFVVVYSVYSPVRYPWPQQHYIELENCGFSEADTELMHECLGGRRWLWLGLLSMSGWKIFFRKRLQMTDLWFQQTYLRTGFSWFINHIICVRCRLVLHNYLHSSYSIYSIRPHMLKNITFIMIYRVGNPRRPNSLLICSSYI